MNFKRNAWSSCSFERGQKASGLRYVTSDFFLITVSMPPSGDKGLRKDPKVFRISHTFQEEKREDNVWDIINIILMYWVHGIVKLLVSSPNRYCWAELHNVCLSMLKALHCNFKYSMWPNKNIITRLYLGNMCYMPGPEKQTFHLIGYTLALSNAGTEIIKRQLHKKLFLTLIVLASIAVFMFWMF